MSRFFSGFSFILTQRGFLILPHDVVKYLCRFVDSLSLIALAQTCKYLLPDCLFIARQRSVNLFGPSGCCKALHLYSRSVEALKPKKRVVKLSAPPAPPSSTPQSKLSFGKEGKLAVVKDQVPAAPPLAPTEVEEEVPLTWSEHDHYWRALGINCFYGNFDAQSVVIKLLNDYGRLIVLFGHVFFFFFFFL